MEPARAAPKAQASGGRGQAEPLIVVVAALSGAQLFGLSILAPLYMLSLGYSIAWLGAVVSAQGAFWFLLTFVGGTVSDRFGERAVMAFAVVGTLGAALLFTFSGALCRRHDSPRFRKTCRRSTFPTGRSIIAARAADQAPRPTAWSHGSMGASSEAARRAGDARLGEGLRIVPPLTTMCTIL